MLVRQRGLLATLPRLAALTGTHPPGPDRHRASGRSCAGGCTSASSGDASRRPPLCVSVGLRLDPLSGPSARTRATTSPTCSEAFPRSSFRVRTITSWLLFHLGIEHRRRPGPGRHHAVQLWRRMRAPQGPGGPDPAAMDFFPLILLFAISVTGAGPHGLDPPAARASSTGSFLGPARHHGHRGPRCMCPSGKFLPHRSGGRPRDSSGVEAVPRDCWARREGAPARGAADCCASAHRTWYRPLWPWSRPGSEASTTAGYARAAAGAVGAADVLRPARGRLIALAQMRIKEEARTSLSRRHPRPFSSRAFGPRRSYAAPPGAMARAGVLPHPAGPPGEDALLLPDSGAGSSFGS